MKAECFSLDVGVIYSLQVFLQAQNSLLIEQIYLQAMHDMANV